MGEQLDTIIDLLQGITEKLYSIEEAVNRLELRKEFAEQNNNADKPIETPGYIRGAAYYANERIRNRLRE